MSGDGAGGSGGADREKGQGVRRDLVGKVSGEGAETEGAETGGAGTVQRQGNETSAVRMSVNIRWNLEVNS